MVLEETVEAGPRPGRTQRPSDPTPPEEESGRRILASLARLRLSRRAPTAALIRGVLLRAATSSPAALAGALRRYRGLLHHAADARRAGRALSRAELRAFAGELDDQLVLWELVADGDGDLEVALEDLDTIDAVQVETGTPADAPDAKLDRLRTLLSDGRPTLVFTTRRETVRHLRDRLGVPVAWCTGDRAGVGHCSAPRSLVMQLFQDDGERAPVPLTRPRILVATDVAAEGLDLRRAERVVHYDLPWTPMRLEQREGRAVRLGSAHRWVDVVRFGAPPSLEAALGLRQRLERKARLPAHAGLGARGVRLWRWRTALADRLGDGPAVSGVALVRDSSCRGVLAGFTLLPHHPGGRQPLAAVIGWLDQDGSWTEDGAVIEGRMHEAGRSENRAPASPDSIRSALDRLVTPIRARLAVAGGRRWAAGEPAPSARRLAARLAEAVGKAARARDRRTLGQLEQALAFVGGGHTAGEAMLVERMADASADRMPAILSRLPAPTPRWDTIEVRLTGVVLFE